MSISGYATREGTAAYALRFPSGLFHEANVGGERLTLSSIGVGTYLGEATPQADNNYTQAIQRALELGVNVLDSAINYRFQRSERSIGSALDGVQREEVFVATKAGFLTTDGGMPANPREYFEREYFARGVMRREDIVGGMHCMTPGFLADQLERSRRNLRLDTIDLFYLHNPETQLSEVDYSEFGRRLFAAFEFLESQVASKKIRWYGAATWNGFRLPPGEPGHLPLEALAAIAQKAGGADHHFRFIQLPHNLAMPEASSQPTQNVDGKACTAIDAAAQLGITVMTSASLLQTRLPDLPQALLFARQTPGVATALVGMGKVEHVEANLSE